MSLRLAFGSECSPGPLDRLAGPGLFGKHRDDGLPYLAGPLALVGRVAAAKLVGPIEPAFEYRQIVGAPRFELQTKPPEIRLDQFEALSCRSRIIGPIPVKVHNRQQLLNRSF